MREAMKRRRCDRDRQRDRLPEHGGRELAPRDVDEDAVVQQHLLPGVHVAPQAALVVGARRVVVPRHLRDLRLRDRLELVEVEDVHHSTTMNTPL
jgi:hypothetical protein